MDLLKLFEFASAFLVIFSFLRWLNSANRSKLIKLSVSKMKEAVDLFTLIWGYLCQPSVERTAYTLHALQQIQIQKIKLCPVFSFHILLLTFDQVRKKQTDIKQAQMMGYFRVSLPHKTFSVASGIPLSHHQPNTLRIPFQKTIICNPYQMCQLSTHIWADIHWSRTVSKLNDLSLCAN